MAFDLFYSIISDSQKYAPPVSVYGFLHVTFEVRPTHDCWVLHCKCSEIICRNMYFSYRVSERDFFLVLFQRTSIARVKHEWLKAVAKHKWNRECLENVCPSQCILCVRMQIDNLNQPHLTYVNTRFSTVSFVCTRDSSNPLFFPSSPGRNDFVEDHNLFARRLKQKSKIFYAIRVFSLFFHI